jgi:hypothetical protein
MTGPLTPVGPYNDAPKAVEDARRETTAARGGGRHATALGEHDGLAVQGP